jgi:pimeloyl-ACP methyl ester carboxylesterase
MTATGWVRDKSAIGDLPRGFFAAGPAAAAALIAAAQDPSLVDAIVSRGGRPDLAGIELGRVQCPVLLLAGGEDTSIISMNRWAMRRLNCVRNLIAIPGATHLFYENGSLGAVCRLARSWFESHLSLEPTTDYAPADAHAPSCTLTASRPSPQLVPS